MSARAQLYSDRTRAGHDTHTILVVDDEPGIRRMVGVALERAGYIVLQAPNAKDAIEQARHYVKPIQLMITDLGLPDADGRDLAARFSRLRPEAKIMFMSGSITLNPATNSLFLQKPFALSDLLEKACALITPDRPCTSSIHNTAFRRTM